MKSRSKALNARRRKLLRKEQLQNRSKKRLILREAYLIDKYGLSLKDRQTMESKQNGCCAICQKATTVLYVDHCHVSGAVRGLLCNSCNSSIGLLNDDIAIVRRAVTYLEIYESVQSAAAAKLESELEGFCK